MEKLLFIDACMRGEVSRTKKIAAPIMERLKQRYEVTTLELNQLPLEIIDRELITKRNNGEVDPKAIGWAEQIRDADRIVIAAPFWDMSYPAALKNFIELCSIFGITFRVEGDKCCGNCKAKGLLYITSRGMDISTGDALEQATPYLKAISWLWGIGPMTVVAAQNIDYSTEQQIEERINAAIRQGLEIAKDF